MARIAVNVDHVATVRQARLVSEPDPVVAAALAELAGAQGIVVHLREDRRHIQDRDVEVLRRTVKTKLNLEMAATEEMVKIALRTKPDVVTLVPEKRQELDDRRRAGCDAPRTVAQGGHQEAPRRQYCGECLYQCRPQPDQDCPPVESDYVEIHTGTFADATTFSNRQEEFERVLTAAKLAHKLGLGVHAGHGVDYRNVLWLRKISEIEEFSIGHAIIARAVLTGLERAVQEMIALVSG